MSRLRKFNRGVLARVNGDPDSDNEIPMHPMDIEEQKELICNMELKNLSHNNQTLQLLSIAYVIACGVFLSLALKVRKLGSNASLNKRLLLFSINSIICSLLNLRYDFSKSFAITRKTTVMVTSRRINFINSVLLLLITWEVTDKVDHLILQLLFHVPLMLFGLSVVSKKWIHDMEEDINSLRGLKYKFKNA